MVPSVFVSYSHKDEGLRDQLEEALAMLKRQGVISVWHDRRIEAGSDFTEAISTNLEAAGIILLLVSPSFLASRYCYEIEMARAMERHERREAIVIPVILRPCDWSGAPFSKLQALPREARPVTRWPDADEAFLSVVEGIKAVARGLSSPGVPVSASSAPVPAVPRQVAGPARSSNLRVAKRFTEQDKDAFVHEAFGHVVNLFEGSLAELAKRNVDINGTVRRLDANRFTAVVYRDGKAAARCTVYIGGWGRGLGGIRYSANDSGDTSSFNECLSVDCDSQKLFLRPMMGGHHLQAADGGNLSPDGAAEYLWGIFIAPLQRG